MWIDGPNEIWIYKTWTGREPFADWLKEIDNRSANQIIKRIDRLAAGSPGRYDSVGGGVFELKIYLGPGYRVYFGRDGLKRLVLLSGGDKSGQVRDILKARGFFKDHERRV